MQIVFLYHRPPEACSTMSRWWAGQFGLSWTVIWEMLWGGSGFKHLEQCLVYVLKEFEEKVVWRSTSRALRRRWWLAWTTSRTMSPRLRTASIRRECRTLWRASRLTRALLDWTLRPTSSLRTFKHGCKHGRVGVYLMAKGWPGAFWRSWRATSFTIFGGMLEVLQRVMFGRLGPERTVLVLIADWKKKRARPGGVLEVEAIALVEPWKSTTRNSMREEGTGKHRWGVLRVKRKKFLRLARSSARLRPREIVDKPWMNPSGPSRSSMKLRRTASSRSWRASCDQPNLTRAIFGITASPSSSIWLHQAYEMLLRHTLQMHMKPHHRGVKLRTSFLWVAAHCSKIAKSAASSSRHNLKEGGILYLTMTGWLANFLVVPTLLTAEQEAAQEKVTQITSVPGLFMPLRACEKRLRVTRKGILARGVQLEARRAWTCTWPGCATRLQ